jgi:putative transposase
MQLSDPSLPLIPMADRQVQGMTVAATYLPLRYRTHAARLYPTASQAEALNEQGHTARALWNLIHEWCTWGSSGHGCAGRPTAAEMDRQLRDARTDPLPDWEWLATLPAQATQQVLKHYLRARNRFFDGLAGPPRFKKRSSHMAVDVPQASGLRIVRLNRRWGRVMIPRIGPVRFRWTRPLPGVSRSCTGRITGARLVRDSLGWRICFRIEEPAIAVAAHSGPPVAIDRGVIHSLALSDGRNLDMPTLLTKREQRRLRRLELQAARKRAIRASGAPASERERRTYRQIAVIRARQARRRNDWLHKATTSLAKNHGVIVVEGLHISSMTRSARGTQEHLGTNVKAKSALNRAILEMAWGKTGRMLAYKAARNNGVFIEVPAAWSSLTCAQCGRMAHGNRRSREWFLCLTCGHAAPADTNAARVLLARGLAALSGTAPGYGVAGRRALADGRATKRQPPTGASL